MLISLDAYYGCVVCAYLFLWFYFGCFFEGLWLWLMLGICWCIVYVCK